MSTVGKEGRSFAVITLGDLRRLLAIAEADIADFFVRYPGWAELYADRLLAVTLCQGAAQHFCFGDTGINDFDVFIFFARNPITDWCYRRHPVRDFGDSRFGKSLSNPEFVGRRVD